MDPGLEFKVAMEEAERLPAKLIYGDADQDHTMRRISENFSMQVLIRFTIAVPVHGLMQGHHAAFCHQTPEITNLMCLIFRAAVRLSAGCLEDAHGRAEDPCRCHRAHERFQGYFKRPGRTGDLLAPKLHHSIAAHTILSLSKQPWWACGM